MSNNGDGDYQSFVKVMENEDADDVMELPAEDDDTILLSTLQGQFPNAVGLKYRSSSGGWRGIRISGEVLNPPHEGWGDTIFMVTMTKDTGIKRKLPEEPVLNEESGKKIKEGNVKASDGHLLADLVVLNLPFPCKDSDLKEYFVGACGEMSLHEVKCDRQTKKSRGFGFIRFKTVEGSKAALTGEHSIMGRKVEIKISKKKEEPMKLFVGRIPEGTTAEDLKTYFSDFGEIKDGYIPTPFRGFGFVTYVCADDGRAALRRSHEITGVKLNVQFCEPKEEKERRKNEEERMSDPRNRGSHANTSQMAFRDSRGSYYESGKRDSRERNRYNEHAPRSGAYRDQYDDTAPHDNSTELRNMLFSFLQGGH